MHICESIVNGSLNMTIEELYVNAFDNTYMAWVEEGTSPYLQNTDADYIDKATSKTATYQEGYWSFPDSAGSGTINSVKLRFETKRTNIAGDSFVKVYVWNGASWVLAGTIYLGWASYAWEEIDVSSILNTWAKINGAKVYLITTKAVDVTDTLYVRRHTRKVDYTIAGGQTITWTASLNTAHALTRPARFMKLTQSLNAVHVFGRPFRFFKLTQTLQALHTWTVTKPGLILKQWFTDLQLTHTFKRPTRFMKLTQTLNTTHAFLRHRFMKLSQILNLAHILRRPYRKIGYAQTLRTDHALSRPFRIIKFPASLQLAHVFSRPSRFIRLLQTLGLIHVYSVTKPGIEPTKMVFITDPIAINLKTGEIMVITERILIIGPIAINLKTGEIMVAI